MQANHLNQNGSYGEIIPKGEGLSNAMRGNAFKDIGSQHYDFHATLEAFWAPYRTGQSLYGLVPTNGQYGNALYRALLNSRLTPAQASFLADQAAAQRISFGLVESDPVPRIPRRLNQSVIK